MGKDPRRAGSHGDDPPHLVEWRVLEEANIDGFLLAPAQAPNGVPKGGVRPMPLRYLHRVGGCRSSEAKTRPSALTALVVAGQVDDALVQPGAKPAHLAWRSRGEPDTHKRLLNDVLSHGVITDEQGCQLDRGSVQREHERLDPLRLRRL